MTGTAFTYPQQRQPASDVEQDLWRSLAQCVGAFNGDAAWQRLLSLTGVTDAASYVVTIQNQHASGLHLNIPGLLAVNNSGISAGPIATSSVAVSGNVTVGGTLGVTGTSTLGVLNAGATGVTTLTASSTVQGTRLISTVATGTAPLAVTSTTRVANLNADLFDDLDSTAFALLSGATFSGNVTVQGNTALGDANTDTLTVIGLSTFRNAANTATQLYVDAGNNRVQVGSATAMSSATSSILEINLGRTYLAPNAESFALGLRYSPSTLGQVWLGASNSATPDLIVSNNATTQTMRMLNGGLLIVGTATSAVGTAGAGDVQCNDVFLVNGSNYRRLVANGTSFQLSNNQDSGTHMTIDSTGLMTIPALHLDNQDFIAGTNRLQVDSTGIGFLGATPVARPTVVGVRTGTLAQLQTVVANLLTALGAGSLGLITDSTT